MQTAGPWTIHRPLSLTRHDHPGSGRRARRVRRRPDVAVVSADLAGAADLQAQLAGEGLVVACVSTGPKVAEHVAALAPRVVVMEVSAAAERPWELPLALDRTAGRSIPVIVVAARPWGEAVGRCLLAGVRTVVLPQERARLGEAIAGTTTATPLDPALAALRLATLRAVGSGVAAPPTEAAPSVRLTRLEHPPTPIPIPIPTPTSAPRPPHLALDELGSAQRRLVEGLAKGRSPRQIAADAGVTSNAVYGASQRLARRLGVSTQQLPEEVRRRSLLGAPTTRGHPTDERTDVAGSARRVA